ncbi:MAG TPA: exodeoxyribonuclease VII large subunit [Thermoanaerobacterales bacterium]|nr:exodeoxyribonuclease VII large subunit [Thermoanaerobacterales bacterium]
MTVLSVNEVTKHIKQILVSDPILNKIHVKGEVSNYVKHTSGHMYFTLKDKKSRLTCVMFSNRNRLLDFQIENGMKIIASGYISVYERGGAYQLYVNDIQPDGIGTLHLAFEQLKEKLEKEGLFSDKVKKPIPVFPQTIGLITSKKGAAIRDFLTVVKRRFPNINIILMPVLVQGPYASEQIANAINIFNEYVRTDVIVITRGGGSIEELWAFNEEIVARSIFKSEIPIITAIGHERDFTISDFVADFRAPTPSAAGELVVPVKREIYLKIKALKRRSELQVQKQITVNKNNLSYLSSKITTTMKDKVSQKQQEVDYRTQNLYKDFRILIERRKNRFINAVGKLNVLSPLKILERGYSITRKQYDKKTIKEISEIKNGDIIETFLHNGQIISKVQVIKKGDGYPCQ